MQLPVIRAYLKATANVAAAFKQLVDSVEETSKKMIVEIKALLAKNKIVYDGLWYVFEKGSQIFSYRDGESIGSTVSLTVHTPMQFSISGRTIKSNGLLFFFS